MIGWIGSSSHCGRSLWNRLLIRQRLAGSRRAVEKKENWRRVTESILSYSWNIDSGSRSCADREKVERLSCTGVKHERESLAASVLVRGHRVRRSFSSLESSTWMSAKQQRCRSEQELRPIPGLFLVSTWLRGIRKRRCLPGRPIAPCKVLFYLQIARLPDF